MTFRMTVLTATPSLDIKPIFNAAFKELKHWSIGEQNAYLCSSALCCDIWRSNLGHILFEAIHL